MHCFILLPCYNEAENLKRLIPQINTTLTNIHYQIIAVDDGSLDDTKQTLYNLKKKYPHITILSHSRNKGLHEALKTGIIYVNKISSNNDVLIIMDADNTHNPQLIPKMIDTYKNTSATVVIASRYIKGGGQKNIPFIRKFLSLAVNLLIRILSRIPIKDFTSGYRLYNITALKQLINLYGPNFIESHGFEVSVELLLKIYYNLKKAHFVEIPLILDYGQKRGKSKMNILLTILLYLGLFKKIIIWRMFSSSNFLIGRN